MNINPYKIQKKLLFLKRFGLIKGIQLQRKFKSQKIDEVYTLSDIHYPFRLRSQTSDIPTFHQIFTAREYDINLNFTPKLIIDAGANIGLAAIFFANKYPNSKVISIEPEQSNYELLKINTQNYENIIALNNALSNESNQDLVVIDNGQGNWGFTTEKHANGLKWNFNSVRSISIDDVMLKYDLKMIDILKIDIEGYEKEVFENNTENWLPNVRCIIVEVHDKIKSGCSKSLFGAISKYDFNFSTKGENLIFINNALDNKN